MEKCNVGIDSNSRTYFAAQNTGNGFISYFREIFDPLEDVYIIKGGSGTGKSRLMRALAEAAERRGYNTERFLCSSDPSSLDGIIVCELGLAVLDGTAPHVHEPTLIGAREHFIDLSAYLDASRLRKSRNEISEYVKAKSRRYKCVSEYLKVISSYDEMINERACAALDLAKLEKAVKKSFLYVSGDTRGEKKVRLRASVGTEGLKILDTYADIAERRFAINDVCGVAHIYLNRLLELTTAADIAVQVSYDPFASDSPDALYYPSSGISFYIGETKNTDDYTINIRRFVDNNKLRPYKPEIRNIKRLRSEALSALMYDMSCIKRIHSSLEEIYGSAMDFSAKECLTEELINRLLK